MSNGKFNDQGSPAMGLGSQGEWKHSWLLHASETGISFSLIGHLAPMQISSSPYTTQPIWSLTVFSNFTISQCGNLLVCFLQDDKSWLHCTLCRSGRQGVSTLNKALLRKVEWPSQTNTSFQSSQVSRNINLHCRIIWIFIYQCEIGWHEFP